jgi:hypothetical protein
MLVACGDGAISAPEDLLALSRPRTRLQKFLLQESREVLLEILRTAHPLASGVGLGSPHVRQGQVELADKRLLTDILDETLAAEAVLRIAWQVAVHRAGGLLMHGCAFHWKGVGIAAIGQSGAGKSTLARLCRSHPAHAVVLSDEILHLQPDGIAYGTPFRSDPDNDGSPGPARLGGLLLLAKGQEEHLDELSPAEALPFLLAELYTPVISVVTAGELRRRLMALVDTVGVHRLTFRKDAAVGPFLRDWVCK